MVARGELSGSSKDQKDRLPTSSQRLQRLFAIYIRRMMRRSFRAVRIAHEDRPLGFDGVPLTVISNHPSWWDPLLYLLTATTLFGERRHYAPIDADALKKYQFFEKLGFFGVERDTRRGAATFLRTGERILSAPESMLWITPQGAFTDVRVRPVEFKSGVGHLARRAPRAKTVPFVFEYVFGQEKLPEIWARFGPPIEADAEVGADERTAQMAAALEAAQDRLAADVIARRTEGYEVLVSGASGVGGVYDVWRRLKAWSRGTRFQPEHGEQP